MPDRRVFNICFHGIGAPTRALEPGEDKYWVGVDQFYRILDEIATWPHLRVSFDDGNASDVEIGLPALKERGLHALFFVLAGRLDNAGSLSEADILELRRQQMGIGTHGMNHIPWRKMTPGVRNVELVLARQRIAEVAGIDVAEVALPLGQYDRRLLADLKMLGYSVVHTSDRRPGRSGAWLQPRFSVTRDDTPQSLRDAVLKPPTARRRIELASRSLLKRLR